MSGSNLINRLFGRIRKIESYKPAKFQLFNQATLSLDFQSSDMGIFTYCSNNVGTLFKTDIDSKNYRLIDIKVSATFMANTTINSGSAIMKLRINDTLLTENEVALINEGYNQITLNYTQNVQKNGIYTVEILYEGCITTSSNISPLPSLNVRNNGASLSIILL